MANFLLSWEQRKDPGSVRFEISQRDSLQERWPAAVDVLLMNPPFVSYEQLTHEQRSAIRSVMGNLARGRMEYSNAFIYKALESLRPDAVIGAIIPSSFYESSAAAQLREWIRVASVRGCSRASAAKPFSLTQSLMPVYSLERSTVAARKTC